MKRYADCFFRYWYIAIAPIIILPLVYFGLGKAGAKSVTVGSSVWASSTSLRELGYYDPGVTPAQNMVNLFTQVLSVSSFDRLVASQSPLYAQVAAKHADPNWPATDLKANLKVIASSGPLLVLLTYNASNEAEGGQVLQTFLRLAPRELEVLNHRGLNTSALKIADPPAATASATSKLKQLLPLLIVFAVGLLLGGAFIVTWTALDRSVRYPDEVSEMLGLPVLGIVPYSPKVGK